MVHTPTVQPLTGYLMMRTVGYTFSMQWLQWTLVLYVIAGACWLPVVWLQLRMRDMARAAVEQGAGLSELFWRYARYWELLGLSGVRGDGGDLLVDGFQTGLRPDANHVRPAF